MIDPLEIVETAVVRTAVIQLKVPRAQIRQFMGPAIGELMATLAAQRIAQAGALYTYHFKMDPEVFDLEVGVPVAATVSDIGRVRPGELPAARVARTLYRRTELYQPLLG